MSFLDADADAPETLEVALAFIDECISSNSSCTSDSFSSSSSSSSSVSCSKPTQRARRQRSSGDAASSRRQRERKKAEALLLREQVAQLEAQLAELQRIHRTGNSLQVFLERLDGRKQSRDREDDGKHDNDEQENGDELLIATTRPSAAAVWIEVAKLQAHERLRSQALNSQLRDAVAKHVVLVQSLEAMLRSNDRQFGLKLLRDEQRRFLEQSYVLSQNTGLLAVMQQRVRNMNEEVDVTFNRKFWRETHVDSTACSIRMKPHAQYGQAVELRMNAPLPCSAERADYLVWRLSVTMTSPSQTPHYFLERKQLSSSSFRKYYGIRLLDAPHDALELQGTTFAQSFESAGRRNYLWTSVIASSSRGDIFREEGWLSISPAAAGSDKSRLQLFYHVFCETHDDAGGKSEGGDAGQARALRAQRAFVLRALGNRTRSYHQLKLNALVDCVSGFLASPPLLLPPVTDTC